MLLMLSGAIAAVVEIRSVVLAVIAARSDGSGSARLGSACLLGSARSGSLVDSLGSARSTLARPALDTLL